jgi:hypothetical protein
MCGRFTVTATPGALNQLFSALFEGLEWPRGTRPRVEDDSRLEIR